MVRLVVPSNPTASDWLASRSRRNCNTTSSPESRVDITYEKPSNAWYGAAHRTSGHGFRGGAGAGPRCETSGSPGPLKESRPAEETGIYDPAGHDRRGVWGR